MRLTWTAPRHPAPRALSLLLVALLAVPAASACNGPGGRGEEESGGRDVTKEAAESKEPERSAEAPAATSNPPITSTAQRFGIPEVDAIIDAEEDGSIVVGEKLEFAFYEGVFNNAFREIPHVGFDLLVDAEVYDSNLTLLSKGAEYKTDWCRGSYVMQWFFNRTVAPANRSFLVFYLLSNALVAPGPYQSGVDWWVIGKEWPHFTEDLSASIKIPGNVTGSPLFTYRPANGTSVEVRDGDTYVHFRARNISAGEGFRVTAYFPRLIPLEIPVERWLREDWLAGIVLFGVLLSLPAAIRTAIKGGRRALARPSSAGPDPLAPALVSNLLHPRARTLQYALATAEVARRGHLTVRKDPSHGSAAITLAAEGPPADLARHERVAFEEGAERGSAREIAAHWPAVGRRFRGALVEDAVERGHFSRAPRAIGYLPLHIVGIVLLVVSGVIMWALYAYYPFWAVVFCGLLLGVAGAGAATIVIGGVLGTYRTPSGDELAGEWGRRLKELRGRRELDPLERLWLMASSGSLRGACDIDEKREPAADDPTPRMKWFSGLE